MNFGDAWKDSMGVCDQATSERILDFYFEQASNFLDTSNNYQLQDSERWVGEWMKKRGNRDQLVVGTKYTTNYVAGGSSRPEIMANFNGNGSKSLALSVTASLEKLQTNYIDVLFVHWWDYSTSVSELMQSLNHLIMSGKVLYLGVSDTPAWVVSKANEYARNNGLRQFSVYQGNWSAASRDFERDIIPMCKAEGMGIMPFGALGGGKFKAEEQQYAPGAGRLQANETEIQVSKAMELIAKRSCTAITSVALAYVMHKAPYVFPILGVRKIDHLKRNIEALTLSLSREDIRGIESAVPFDLGFPHNMIWGLSPPDNYQDVFYLNMGGTCDYVPEPQPITPSNRGE